MPLRYQLPLGLALLMVSSLLWAAKKVELDYHVPKGGAGMRPVSWNFYWSAVWGPLNLKCPCNGIRVLTKSLVSTLNGCGKKRRYYKALRKIGRAHV